jgi:PAS domain S-box-containing protein
MISEDGFILGRFTARFIPPKLRTGTLDEQRRAQVILWFWVAVVFWAPCYVVLYDLLDQHECVRAIVVATALALTVPFILRRTGSVWLAGNVFTLILTALLIVLVTHTGGHNSPVRTWLVLTPLIAVVLAGLRSTIAWTSVALFFVGGLDAAAHLGYLDLDKLAPTTHHILDFTSLSVLLVVMCTLAWTYDHFQRRTLALAEGRTEDLRVSLEQNLRIAQKLEETNQALAAHLKERRRAERALRASERLLANIISAIPFHVFWKDQDSVYIGCNDRMAAVSGLAHPDEIRGKTDYELPWTREQADWFRQCDRQVMDAGEPLFNIEETQRQADGTDAVALTSKVPLRDDDNNVIGVLGVYADITERKQMEERLRLQGSALASAANAVVITDLAGIIVWVNPAFSQMTGYASEEAVGRYANMLKSGKHPAAFYSKMWKTISSGNVWQGELVNKRKDCSLYHEHMTITPVRDESGQVAHFVAIKQDITHRLRAERLANERDRLREAVKAHEHVLGVVGHELRTPLAGLGIIAELLERTEDRNTAEFESFLHCINDEVQRMSGMVNDLLEVARLDSGIAKWHWGEVAVAKACNDAAASIQPLIDAQRVALTVTVDPQDLHMPGDETAVRRLVLNLLSNASKHTTDGSIAVSARQLVVDGDRIIELVVADTGSGMSPETAAHLGEAFALNSGVVGEKYVAGSGLGLAICRGIVSAHGGTFSVRSTMNQGTQCIVRLRGDLPAPCASGALVDIATEVKS